MGTNPLRNHFGRITLSKLNNLKWRYQTLRIDYSDLIKLENPPERFIRTVQEEQINEQGYLFDVERRLHNYLSGLFSYTKMVESFRDSLSDPPSSGISETYADYRRVPSTKTVLGLRHYAQHTNIIPVTIYSSNLENNRKIAIDIDDLRLQNNSYDNGFEHHYGHIEDAYMFPIPIIKDNWQDVEAMNAGIKQCIEEDVGEEIQDYYEEVERYRELMDEILTEDLPQFMSESGDNEQDDL